MGLISDIRYYFEINDAFLKNWPHKYIIGYVGWHQSGIFYGQRNFNQAMIQSDRVIRCSRMSCRYIKYKSKDPEIEEVEPETLMFMKLACEDF